MLNKPSADAVFTASAEERIILQFCNFISARFTEMKCVLKIGYIPECLQKIEPPARKWSLHSEWQLL
jgi:hypothetical protein